MDMSTIKIGTRLESNKLVMVVTGENEKSFTGYIEYKGQNKGECSLSKDMFTNPHYMKDIKVIDENNS